MNPRVVALGGGHGLHATLSALRHVVDHPTAVVTVADNGGSSGRLRGEFGVLPPGDLRMALAALCGDDEWGQTWERVLQHRFAGDGEMRGHVVGNLLIVSLWELLGDHVAALQWVARLLGAEGTVLPMATTPMDITAEVRGLDPADPARTATVRGQVEVATTDGQIVSISLDPADPAACPEAVAAVRDADWVVLGPGSWYSSVIPHLMVPALRGRAGRDRRPAGRRPEPRGPGGGDPRLRPRGPPRRPARARAGPHPAHRPGGPVDAHRRADPGAGRGLLGSAARGRRRGVRTTVPRATTRGSWRRRSRGSWTPPGPRGRRRGCPRG